MMPEPICANCGAPAAWQYWATNPADVSEPATLVCDGVVCRPVGSSGLSWPLGYNRRALDNVHGRLAELREHLVERFADLVYEIEGKTPEEQMEAVLTFTGRLPAGRAFNCQDFWDWLEDHRSRLDPAQV